MADTPSLSEQLGASPAKLALIAVLAVVLLVVLYIQFGGGSGAVAPPPAAQPRVAAPSRTRPQAANNASKPAVPPGAKNVGEAESRQWRPTDLASVTRYDPFSLPVSFPQPAFVNGDSALAGVEGWAAAQVLEQPEVLEQRMQTMHAELNALRSLGVQVVIRRDDHYVALIGDRTIQVGDEIDGFKVIAIDSGGVHVARNLTP